MKAVISEFITFNYQYTFKKEKINGFFFRKHKNYNGDAELRFIVLIGTVEYTVDRELVQTDALALDHDKQLKEFSKKWLDFVEDKKEI